MCGIAGYNVSKPWAEKYINSEKMEKVLREAWLHNIHRGHEAAGFFSVDLQGDLTTYKSPGRADKIFESDFKDNGILDVARVFAAHTREPSANAGHPKHNENNHPVLFRNVAVTHNGTIYNDESVIDSVDIMENEKLPEVDSIAIAVALSTVSNPLEQTEDLRGALEMLRGSMAIHAVWEDHPGLSLLARGKTSPLVLAQHSSGAFFYASEKEAIWHMIDQLGLKAGIGKGEGGWTYKNLDPGSWILLQSGEPVDWGTFSLHKGNYSKNLDFYMKRYIPKSGKEEGHELVYLTDLSFDYINKVNGRFSLHKNKYGKKAVVYDREKRGKNVFPTSSGETSMEGVCAEADRIVKNGDMLHAFFGNVELVLTSGRVLRDVFNHDLMDNKDRWVKQNKNLTEQNNGIIAREVGGGDDWDKFFGGKKTTHIREVKGQDYPYLKESDSGKVKSYSYSSDKDHQHGTRDGSNNNAQTTLGDLLDRQRMKPDILLAWESKEEAGLYSIQRRVTPHVHDEELAFVHDVRCAVHKQKLSQHDMPRECEVVLLGASYTLACFTDLTLWYYFNKSDNAPDVDWIGNGGINWCSTKEGKDGCQFIESETVQVHAQKAWWDIVTEEECYYCGGRRRLSKLPDWFKKINHGKRQMTFLTPF